MIPKKRFLASLLGGRVDHPACASVCQTATEEQMKEVGAFWPSAHYHPEEMARLAVAGAQSIGFDAVRVPFCQTVEAEALGCALLEGTVTSPPSIRTHPLQIGEDLAIPADLLERGRIPVVLGAIRHLKDLVGQEFAIIGGIIGPFSLVGHLVGVEELMVASMTEPEALRPLLERAVEVGIQYAQAMVAQGADVICIEDMEASPDLINPKTYQDLILAFERYLIAHIPVPTILHICGNATAILEGMIASGADGISIEAKTDLEKAKALCQGRVSLIGPLDPVSLLLSGTPEEVYQESLKALSAGVDILAPGCGIAPLTPSVNLKAMVQAASTGSVQRSSPPSYILTGNRYVTPQEYPRVYVRYDVLWEEKARPKGLPSAEKVAPLQRGIREVEDSLDPVFKDIHQAVLNGDTKATLRTVEKALERFSPEEVLQKGLIQAIERVGKLWQEEQVFLPQVILASDAMQAGMRLCEEAMGKPAEKQGRVVMHVAEGDVHSIGKNIVKALLIAYGFEVIDLGVDVPVERVVQAVKEYQPHLLTGSALMTTTMSAFPKVAQRLIEEGIEIPFACGGGAVTQQFCEQFPLAIYGEKAPQGPAIARSAVEGKSWQEIRKIFHK